MRSGLAKIIHLLGCLARTRGVRAALNRLLGPARRLRMCKLPHSPLDSLTGDGAALRTGFTHFFARREGVDRTPAQVFRAACRAGEFEGQTSGRVPGFVQANLVCLPEEHAFAFLSFCLKNPRACPLLDVTEPGDPCPKSIAPSADLRTDLPKYRVWRYGEVLEEPTDIRALWDDRMVGFLLGCSFSWEAKLIAEHLTPRNVEAKCNVPMYRTNIRNVPSGPFGGELVVSMRPYPADQLAKVAAITARYPGAHGGPVHWGDAMELGIDLGKPDWGDTVEIREGEVPVFWACGVTPHAALLSARLPLAITHSPGHMLVADLVDSELEVP